MKLLPYLLLVGMILAALAPMAESSHTPRHRWESLPAEKRESALDRAEQYGMFARLQMDAGGNVTGRFVDFHYAKDMGTIHNFTVKHGTQTALVFDAVTPSPFTLTEEPFVTGNVFRSPNTGLNVTVHNNPVALGQWTVPANASAAVTVTFDLATGVTINTLASKNARLDKGVGHVHLVGRGNVTLANVTGDVTATIQPGGRLMFAAHPPGGHMAAFLHVMNSLYERGVLGGVYWMVGVEGTAVIDGLDTDVIVNVQTIRKGHITIQTDSNATGPRVFVFVIDRDTFDPTRVDRIKARLNGQAMAEASTETDVETGTQAKVRVLRGQEVAVVFVMVPHFSQQTIVLEEEGSTETGTTTTGGGATTSGGTKTGTPGASLAALVLAVSLALVLGRLRR